MTDNLKEKIELLDLKVNSASENSIEHLKEIYQKGSKFLETEFNLQSSISEQVYYRSALIDKILKKIWKINLNNEKVCLVAVGGYGREELHPYSDIDILIISQKDPKKISNHIENLISSIWDIGLYISHSVRNVDQCIHEAKSNVITFTNILESRFLIGEKNLFQQLHKKLLDKNIWPNDTFLLAKILEQKNRHAQVDFSNHELEPNIKSNPGGLRDIQVITWIAKKYLGISNLNELIQFGFLTNKEYQKLKDGEEFLWKIRSALHLLTKRQEDRLLFEHQLTLANQFGYNDKNSNLAVEQFMQKYYRTAVSLQRINEITLQLFREEITKKTSNIKLNKINNRFQENNNYIEVTNPAIFIRQPSAMIEIFLLLQKNPKIKGIRANTIRLIEAHRYLIGKSVRKSKVARKIFMEILRQPVGVYGTLRKMHRYGVLACYIPDFKKISGLMQFDLFHLYTVDEHILMVIRNLRRFTIKKFKNEHILCHEKIQQIKNPEILYLAALFHDIAKGKGGDHSDIGAEYVAEFCANHGLSKNQTSFVSWLVKNHLFMSTVAQKQDIDDPEVIYNFAKSVGSIKRLNGLYLLTCADMKATNPKRWNSWKGALIDKLYQVTYKFLNDGLDKTEDTHKIIEEIKLDANQLLRSENINVDLLSKYWSQFKENYFLSNTPDAIAWHTSIFFNEESIKEKIKVFIRKEKKRGCNEILIFGPDKNGLFLATTAILDKLGINVLGAQVDITSKNLSINSYFVLEENGNYINSTRSHEIISSLNENLSIPFKNIVISRRMPRIMKNFVQNTEIIISHKKNKKLHLQIKTHDRPGLLASIGKVLIEHNMRLSRARVITEGEIANDIFLLEDIKNKTQVNVKKLDDLKKSLLLALDG